MCTFPVRSPYSFPRLLLFIYFVTELVLADAISRVGLQEKEKKSATLLIVTNDWSRCPSGEGQYIQNKIGASEKKRYRALMDR